MHEHQPHVALSLIVMNNMMAMALGRLLVLFISLSRIASCYAQGEAQIHVWVIFKSKWLVSFLVVECESDLKYLMQPPTEIDCNPYIDKELSLICAVEASNTSDISIVWFRRTTIDSGREELTASSERLQNGTGRLQSRFTRTGLNSRNDAGEYWCQVRLKSAGTLLQDKSNILILYNETHYQHQSQCREMFVNQQDCLDVAIDPSALTDPMQSAPFSEISPTPDGMAEELEDSGKNLVALYAVVSVIAVFCIVIVILTITIVVLYRKKCGPVRFKTEGE